MEIYKEIAKTVKKWEKNFDKKMTPKEEGMFRWGITYGVEMAAKIVHQEDL